MAQVELVVAAQAALAESPWWDEASGELVFVDIVAGTITRWRPGTGPHAGVRTEIGELVGAVVRRARGGLILALADGLAELVDGREPRRLWPVEADRSQTRLNDAACDPAGRLFVGTMSGVNEPGLGSLYRLDPDGTITAVVTGTTISNGMGWSPDARTMYFADSPTGRVDAFDYDLATGALTGRRPLVRFADGDGHPDGLTVDAEGCLWVASFGGAHVARFDPAGQLLERVEVPADNVTSCCFGGPELTELYITTARIELDEAALARQPDAGGVFRYRPGVRGRLDTAFAG